jgi:hypothetical protein
MVAHLPRLRFSLDPLVGEAKRRTWRRRVMVTLMLAVAVVGVTFGVRAFYSPGGGPTAEHAPLSGSWHGIPWSIRAADSGDGRYGMSVFIAGSPAASRSGRFYVPGPGGIPLRLGLTADAHGRLPFVAGAIAITPCCEQNSADVTIRLSDGGVEATTATVPPYSLTHVPGIAFFFVPTPRGAHPTSIVARNAAGHVITVWKYAH